MTIIQAMVTIVVLPTETPRSLHSMPGDLSLSGSEATFHVATVATPGNLALTGTDSRLSQSLENTNLAIDGTAAGFHLGMRVQSGTLGLSGPSVNFDDRLGAEPGQLPLSGSATSLNAVWHVGFGDLPITGSAANLLPPEASFSGTVVNYYDIALTGVGGMDSWEWTDELGIILSTQQSPTLNFQDRGPAQDVDLTLRVRLNGVWSAPVTDSFALGTPPGDDVAWGDVTFTESGTTGVRLTANILRAKNNGGQTLTAPQTVRVSIWDDTTDTELFFKIVPWGSNPGNWTDPTGFVFSGSITEGGTLSFDSLDHAAYRIKLETQGGSPGTAEIVALVPAHLIYRAGGTPIGTAVSTGAWQINKNVDDLAWSLSDVAKYDFSEQQYPQRLRQEDSDQYTTAIDALKARVPEMISVFNLRYDLARYGPGTPLRPLESWGSADFPHPTLAMGDTPRSGNTWADMVTALTNAGYVQDAANKSQTDYLGATTLTCPYRVWLQPGSPGTWVVYENQMDVTNADWLELISDSYVKWRSSTNCDGYIIAPIKIQFADPWFPTSIEYLTLWQFANDNPGWDLASDSGGESGRESWGNQTRFDNGVHRVLDVLEASWEMVRIMRRKDPTAHIIFDPIYLHVEFGTATQGHYETQWIADNGGTATDAKNYFVERQHEMKSLAHYLMPSEADAPSLGLDYIPLSDRDELRRVTSEYRVVIYPDSAQTVL